MQSVRGPILDIRATPVMFGKYNTHSRHREEIGR
jgi:hypothetical protein